MSLLTHHRVVDLPRRLGPHLLVKRLGAGGMAEVFLAIAYGASGLEKKVAIKTLLPELHGRGDLERLLIEEARLGARLSHRNLVGVHDLGVDDGTYWVRMDWVDGVDLAKMLERGPLPPPIALAIAAEIALALDWLHRATDDAGRSLGLVHRDVSPSNVLISRAGEVKLGDFGIAKATLLADLTRGNVRKGKYCYMSPEHVAGAALGPASDQFGLGVTLAEMLTGERPFDGADPLETMDRIREAVPPPLPGIPPDHAAIIRRCLARDPSERFPTTEHLWLALSSHPVAGPLDLARFSATFADGSLPLGQ